MTDSPGIAKSVVLVLLIVLGIIVAIYLINRLRQKQLAPFKETVRSLLQKHMAPVERPYGQAKAPAPDGCVGDKTKDNDDEWDAGYKTPEHEVNTMREKMLQRLGQNAMRAMAAQTVPQLETPDCEPCEHMCDIKTDWKASFIGFPSTFIPVPEEAGGSCWDKAPDMRAYFKHPSEVQYERSRRIGEIWDPYTEHRARQYYMQFLASGMVNRKATHERPIEQLEESVCFQNIVQQRPAAAPTQ